jgi:hypothetical protein
VQDEPGETKAEEPAPEAKQDEAKTDEAGADTVGEEKPTEEAAEASKGTVDEKPTDPDVRPAD